MSAILEGRRLGVFRLVRLLGRGGMGAVYLGHDTALDRQVAVKILPPELSGDEEYVGRFVREGRAAAQINHPHVVQVYSVGYEQGLAFMALELVQGGSLADLVKQAPPGTRRSVEIVRDAARGLSAAHELGVIHRDIKPENVLLGAKGQVKLADFGLARIETGKKITKSGSYLGTPHYSSPEQCNGDELGPASDLYSLGVVLYELLARELPFEAPTPLALFSKILSQPPPSLRERRPDLPPSLVAVVERLLAKDPADRPLSADALIAELEAVLRGLPPEDEEEGKRVTVQLEAGSRGGDTAGPDEARRLLAELTAGSASVLPGAPRPQRGLGSLVGRLALVGLGLGAGMAGLLWWGSALQGAARPVRAPRVAILDWKNGSPDQQDFAWLAEALPEFVAAGLPGVDLVEPDPAGRAALEGADTARVAAMQALGADYYVAGRYFEQEGKVAVVTQIYGPAGAYPALNARLKTFTFAREEVLDKLGEHGSAVGARLQGELDRLLPGRGELLASADRFEPGAPSASAGAPAEALGVAAELQDETEQGSFRELDGAATKEAKKQVEQLAQEKPRPETERQLSTAEKGAPSEDLPAEAPAAAEPPPPSSAAEPPAPSTAAEPTPSSPGEPSAPQQPSSPPPSSGPGTGGGGQEARQEAANTARTRDAQPGRAQSNEAQASGSSDWERLQRLMWAATRDAAARDEVLRLLESEEIRARLAPRQREQLVRQLGGR